MLMFVLLRSVAWKDDTVNRVYTLFTALNKNCHYCLILINPRFKNTVITSVDMYIFLLLYI